jgi:hypothetical protein
MSQEEIYQALRTAMRMWDEVYRAALQNRDANPDGSHERADQLARAYMSGWIRSHEPK